MAVSYEAIEREAQKRAKRQQESYAAQRRAAAQEQKQQVTMALTAGAQPAIDGYTRQLKTIPVDAAVKHAGVAVTTANNKSGLEALLADRGLVSEGIRGAGTRRIERRRRRSDAEVRGAQETKAGQAQQSLDKAAGSLASSVGKQTAAIDAAAEKDIAANAVALYKKALDEAMKLYKEQLKIR